MNTPVAQLDNIIKRFGTQVALDHLSITVEKGEVFGLLGPNGAGKTTCIRILSGLSDSNSGTVKLFGERMNGNANSIKRRLGIVPQELAIYDMLTAAENIEYFGRLYGLKGDQLKERVKYTLNIVGLSDVGKKLPKKFSGGMKRRLNIACSIVHKPELLIMDEPTVGIDPQSRNHILSFVHEYAKHGATIIYTSHYMEEVERLCSRVAIMDEGRVIAQGTVEELTRTLLFEEQLSLEVQNPSPAFIEQIKAVQGVRTCELTGRRLDITSERDSANVARILELATPYEIISIMSERPTLEDVFLTLTGKKLRDEGES
ncbi:MAG TPA: ABC transporter ATP-binding protein [Oscillospiraceae bacterium]|nr:ABC transporter ATP-binding protein [Oscillospiraceae bacterium]